MMTKLLRTLALASLAAFSVATAGCATCNDEPTPSPGAGGDNPSNSAAPGASNSRRADPNELVNMANSTKRIHLKLPDVDGGAAEQHD